MRDTLLKRAVFDIDLEVFGVSIEDFEKAMERVGAVGVGKSFFVYKLKSIDISLPRRENKTGYGHRGFEVSLVDEPKLASRRRDFTINSLMFDTKSLEIVDFWGGLEDLESRLLRATFRESFIEDSLRVLRGVQFSARLKFRLEEESCRLCYQMDLGDLPKERIFIELQKLFKAPALHFGLKSLIAVDGDRKIFGFKISREEFFRVSRSFLRYQRNFQPHLQEFYFLAILRREIEFDIKSLLRKIGTPKIYFKKLLNLNFPEKITVEFVADLAKKEPIRDSVLSFDDEVVDIAKKIGVWDRAFETGVTPRELLKHGFSGKSLGLELERLRVEKIAKLSRELKERD